MPTRTYINKTFRGDALLTIQRADNIARAYQAQGYDLTLRQLYYQFVSRGLIPNKDTEYKRLGSIINDARLAGYLDWDFIVDRTRNMEENSHWTSPAGIIRSAARSFAIDKWAEQETYVEVWIEKDALKGVLEGVCPANDVPYFSCRGYTSQSEIWGAAQRLGDKIAAGKRVIVIHLGDHDPSGIDMSRDIEDRLALFMAQDLDRVSYDDYTAGEYNQLIDECKDALMGEFEINRIALNMDQVRAYNPPPNPAKLTDARAVGYIATHGNQSWELDALDPATLTALIQNAIDAEKDFEVWNESVSKEDKQRETLTKAAEQWARVADFLEQEDTAS